MRRVGFVFGALALYSAPAAAQDEEYEAVRVHSDLPIYTFNYEDVWPRSIRSQESDRIVLRFGCTSRVSFGDWKFTPNPSDEYGDEWWLRVSNYGVFHCAANLRHADTINDLENGEFSRGLFVRIGDEDVDEPRRELWILQQGFVPGSDYIFLARDLNEERVTSFTVLQRRCPIGAYREVLGMDVWTTGYCAINSDTDMFRFASEMLKLPPLGELTLQKDPEAKEASGSD